MKAEWTKRRPVWRRSRGGNTAALPLLIAPLIAAFAKSHSAHVNEWELGRIDHLFFAEQRRILPDFVFPSTPLSSIKLLAVSIMQHTVLSNLQRHLLFCVFQTKQQMSHWHFKKTHTHISHTTISCCLRTLRCNRHLAKQQWNATPLGGWERHCHSTFMQRTLLNSCFTLFHSWTIFGWFAP